MTTGSTGLPSLQGILEPSKTRAAYPAYNLNSEVLPLFVRLSKGAGVPSGMQPQGNLHDRCLVPRGKHPTSSTRAGPSLCPAQAPVCGFFALAVLPTRNTLPSYPLSKHHSPAESNRSNLEPPSTNASGNLSSTLGTGGITRSFLPHTIQPAPKPDVHLKNSKHPRG